MTKCALAAAAWMLLGHFAWAQLGTETVYQTAAPDSPHYRTFATQVTGNARINYGDEIRLGGTARYLTNISVGTQTWPGSPAYTPAYIELSVWLNDGPPGNFGASEPGTLLAKSRVPGPSYPAGGTPWTYPGIAVDFPLPQLLVPDVFTFTIINLNAEGVPDGYNPDGNSWGPWLSTGRTTRLASGVTTNVIGDSNTGPWVTSQNPGAWTWSQSANGWGNGLSLAAAVEATITAAFAPILGDMDGDGDRDNFDIQPFENALTSSTEYLATYPRLTDYQLRGDIDGDGDFDNFDIQPFESLLTGGQSGSSAAVPEPGAIGLLLLGSIGVWAAHRRRHTPYRSRARLQQDSSPVAR